MTRSTVVCMCVLQQLEASFFEKIAVTPRVYPYFYRVMFFGNFEEDPHVTVRAPCSAVLLVDPTLLRRVLFGCCFADANFS